jgi:hypothetical protein
MDEATVKFGMSKERTLILLGRGDDVVSLPQCTHGRNTCDWSGMLLKPQCGCRDGDTL